MSDLRKYGAATTIMFPLVVAGAQDFFTGTAPVVGDVQISKDEGGFTTTTNLPAHVGGGVWSLALTATEMQAARVSVIIIDATATKIFEDQMLVVDTYGDASAQHAFDLDTAEQDVNLVNWRGTQPNVLDTGLVESDVERWRGVVPNVPVSGRVDASVGAMAGAVLTAAAIASDAITAAKMAANTIGTSEFAQALVDKIADALWDEAKSGHVAGGSFGEEVQSHSIHGDPAAAIAAVQADTDDIQTRLPAALVGGRMDASVGAMVANVLTAAAIASDALTSAKIDATFGQEVADEILKRAISNVEPGATFRTLYGAIASLVNLARINSSGNLEVYKTNDTDILETLIAQTDTDQKPITELNPP